MNSQHKFLKLITKNNVVQLDELSTDGRAMFEFLCLITDIKYRLKYSKSFEVQKGRGYSKEDQSKKVVADHISPVDNGLLRH